MSYGLEIFNAAGTKVFSSASLGPVHAMAIADVVQVPAGGGSSKSYPELAGGTLAAFAIAEGSVALAQPFSSPVASTGVTNGVPFVSWTGGTLPGRIYVFCTALASNGFGLLVNSDQGALVVSDRTENWRCIGSGVRATTGGWPAWGTGSYPQTASTWDFTSTAPILPFIKPNGTQRFSLLWIERRSATVWRVYVSGSVADVIAFVPPSVPPPDMTHGLNVFRADGSLAWRSSYVPLVVRGATSVANNDDELFYPPPSAGTNLYALTSSPGFRRIARAGDPRWLDEYMSRFSIDGGVVSRKEVKVADYFQTGDLLSIGYGPLPIFYLNYNDYLN